MTNFINHHTIQGTLGRIEEKKTKAGKNLLVLRIATEEGKAPKRTVYWHRVIVWGGLATKYLPDLRKGQVLEVEGPVHHRSFDSNQGGKKWVTETVARSLKIVEQPRRQTVNEAPVEEIPLDDISEDTEFATEEFELE